MFKDSLNSVMTSEIEIIASSAYLFYGRGRWRREGGLIVFNVILSEDFGVVNRMELFIYYTRGSINFDPFSYLIPFSPRNFNWIVILS